MSDARGRILEGLKKAIAAERDGYNFYLMAAASTEDPKGRDVFRQLADEELEHERYLRGHYKAMAETGQLDPGLKLGGRHELSGPHPIFSEELRTRAASAHFEMSAVSIGAQLELNAIQFYKGEAEAAGDPAVVAFYEELAAWEKGHYDALSLELQGLREDYWSDAGFSPF